MTLYVFFYLTLLTIHFFLILYLSIFRKHREKKDINSYHTYFYVLCIMLALLVAFRPVNIIPDSQPYRNRYLWASDRVSFTDIINASSFYRGTVLSMSKPVNTLFFIFSNLHVPYSLFVFIIVCAELAIFFKYMRKICIQLDIVFNEYLILLLLLVFFSYRYQFIAFAQSMSMVISAPVLYCIIKRSYLKAIVLLGVAASIHIAGFYLVVIVSIYLLTPRIKNRLCTIIWGTIGFLQFTGLAYRYGRNLSDIAGIIVDCITKTNPIYDAYSIAGGNFVISNASILLWLFCGIMILSYNERSEYWKLVNVVILSAFVESAFSFYDIVHRFTDYAHMFIPLLTLIYYYDSHSIIIFDNRGLKRIIVASFLLLEFIAGVHLMGFY